MIENAQKVEVTLSNKHISTRRKLCLQDKAHDLALLQISGAKDLSAAVLSESRDLQVGQNVYAIGNPFGLNGTMTTGIISSIRSVKEPQGATIENAHPDRCGDQPGQFRRTAVELARRSHRHEHPDRHRGRGTELGDWLCHSRRHHQGGAVGLRQVRPRPQAFSRHRNPWPSGRIWQQQIGLPADYGVLVQKVIPGGAAERAGLRGG